MAAMFRIRHECLQQHINSGSGSLIGKVDVTRFLDQDDDCDAYAASSMISAGGVDFSQDVSFLVCVWGATGARIMCY